MTTTAWILTILGFVAAYGAFLAVLASRDHAELYRTNWRLSQVQFHLLGLTYNYRVAFWRRLVIASGMLVSPEWLGWPLAHRLAPDVLVD